MVILSTSLPPSSLFPVKSLQIIILLLVIPKLRFMQNLYFGHCVGMVVRYFDPFSSLF